MARALMHTKKGREMPQTGAAVSGGERRVTDEGHGERSRHRDPQRSGPAGSGDGVPGRRTVTIRGRGAERYPDGVRRRPVRRHERAGFRPDRAALWAVLLGVMLILAAVASAHPASL
jgi:hypothetical protein